MHKGTRIVVLAVLLIGFYASVPAHAAEAVYDAAVHRQTIENGVNEIAKMVEQINQLKMQYEQLQRTYNAITGVRNLGDVFNNPLLASYLPQDWRDVYATIKAGGYSGLTGAGREIRDFNKIFDICADITDSTAKLACEREVANAYQHAAFGLAAYDKTAVRLQQIKDLMAKLNTTTDQKAALEMIGRLSAEQAMIQNEATRLQLYAMLVQNEQRLIEQQQKEVAHQQMKKRGFVDFRPVDLTK